MHHLHEGTVVAEGQLRKAGSARQLALFQKGVRQQLQAQVEKSRKVRTQQERQQANPPCSPCTVPTIVFPE